MKIEDIQKQLLELNVNGMTENKPSGSTSLTYLSWANAWKEFIKIYPNATYSIKTSDKGLPYFESDGGAIVYTTVTVEGIERMMWLPVMDMNNNAMKRTPYEYTTKWGKKTVQAFDMFDVNKTVMRCLTKNLAMFGLGIYIYAGEDMPDVVQESKHIDNVNTLKETKEENKTVEKVESIDVDCSKWNIDKVKDFLKQHKQSMEYLEKNNKTIDTVSEKWLRERTNKILTAMNNENKK